MDWIRMMNVRCSLELAAGLEVHVATEHRERGKRKLEIEAKI